MKIGDLPSVSSPTSQYKVPLEDTSGSAKKSTLSDVMKLAPGGSIVTYSGASNIFDSYTGTAYTITSANLYVCGKIANLQVVFNTTQAVNVSSVGAIPDLLTIGMLKSGLRPKGYVMLGTARADYKVGSIAINSADGRFGVFSMPIISNDQYTIASGTQFRCEALYLLP